MICAMAKRRVPLGFKSVRDILTVAVGVAGLAYETLVPDVTRPTMIAVFVGLIGYPLVIRESRKDDDAPK